MNSDRRRSEELTKGEEEVMQKLWELGKGFVKDVRKAMDEPRPAYNTVLTMLRILERKGFVGHEAVGRSHRYHPLITKEAYSKRSLEGLKERYFEGSYKKLLSFLAQEEGLSSDEVEEIRKLIEEKERRSK